MKIDIGLDDMQRQSIADALSRFLADSYTLYLRTHSYHWNITGPMFNSLHLMFEVQYNENWTALDAIAERIRALGHPAPGSYTQFARLSRIPDYDDAVTPGWKTMVERLVEGNEAVCRSAREVFKLADAADDQPTADLLTQRLNIHEKNAWMLRSLLD